MTATARQPSQLRPFAVIGYSVDDEVLCPSCLRVTTPITGERMSHVCRRGPRTVPDALRKRILALDLQKVRPTAIAEDLETTLPTVMRVLSGDADDAASCPACEASKRTESRELIPLYCADASVREESCTYCGHGLVEIALRRAADATPTYSVEHVTYGKGYPALRFDRRPPQAILQALKDAGWRWRPDERVWTDLSGAAEVPARLQLPPKPVPAAARPPVIRRRRDATRTGRSLIAAADRVDPAP